MKRYRVVQLAGHEIYRIEEEYRHWWHRDYRWRALREWHIDLSGDCRRTEPEFSSRERALKAADALRAADYEREVRAQRLWMPISHRSGDHA